MKKPKEHISMKPMFSDPIDPMAVVSSTDMTGMFSVMPEEQYEADLLMDVGLNTPPIVPTMAPEIKAQHKAKE